MSFVDFIPAELLIPTEDVPLFFKWQDKFSTDPEPDPGYIRYASDYWSFVEHRDRQKDNCGSAKVLTNKVSVAVACGHRLHPADLSMADYCPVCEVQMHLMFLDAIAEAFRKTGGPWCRPRYSKSRYRTLRGAWNMARHQLLELLDTLYIGVKYEDKWNTDHPDEAKTAQQNNSYNKAVRLATLNVKYPAFISHEPSPRMKWHISEIENAKKRKNTKPEKKVTFTPDTNFEPGRPGTEYRRCSESYSPGKHGCPPDHIIINTSGYKTVQGDMRNLKLYVTIFPTAFYSTENDSSLRPGHYQGLIGMHPGARAIDDFLMQYRERTRDTPRKLRKMIARADALIILVDGDAVLDARFSCLPNVEDQQDDEKEEHGQKGWTCLRECLTDKPFCPDESVVLDDEKEDAHSNRSRRKRQRTEK